MSKYKILWLDDFFAPLTSNFDKEFLNKCANFQEEIAQAKLDYDLEIDSIWDINQFPDYVQNIKQYQAVVFDLRGLNPDDSTDLMPMPSAYNQIKDKGVLAYVYSANTNDAKFSITLDQLKKEGRCFSKGGADFETGRTALEVLLDKVVADLGSSLNFYEGHEECLNIFKNGWLDSDSRPDMDSILSIHHDRNYLDLPAGKMRKIMEMIAHKLIEVNVLPSDTQTKIKQWTRCFCNSYNRSSDGDTPWDYNSPSIPYGLCGRDVRVMMNHLANALDENNHYFKTISNERIRQYIWSSVYDAFFVVIWWFDWFMKNLENLDKYVAACFNKEVIAKMSTTSQAPLNKVRLIDGETYEGTLNADRDDESKMRVFVAGVPFPPEVRGSLPSNLKKGDKVTFVARNIDSFWVATDVK